MVSFPSALASETAASASPARFLAVKTPRLKEKDEGVDQLEWIAGGIRVLAGTFLRFCLVDDTCAGALLAALEAVWIASNAFGPALGAASVLALTCGSALEAERHGNA